MIRDFNFQVWDKEKYNEYIEYLISLRDEKLEKFNKKIIPTKYKILGIKIPILKKEKYTVECVGKNRVWLRKDAHTVKMLVGSFDYKVGDIIEL